MRWAFVKTSWLFPCRMTDREPPIHRARYTRAERETLSTILPNSSRVTIRVDLPYRVFQTSSERVALTRTSRVTFILLSFVSVCTILPWLIELCQVYRLYHFSRTCISSVTQMRVGRISLIHSEEDHERIHDSPLNIYWLIHERTSE